MCTGTNRPEFAMCLAVVSVNCKRLTDKPCNRLMSRGSVLLVIFDVVAVAARPVASRAAALNPARMNFTTAGPIKIRS